MFCRRPEWSDIYYEILPQADAELQRAFSENSSDTIEHLQKIIERIQNDEVNFTTILFLHLRASNGM